VQEDQAHAGAQRARGDHELAGERECERSEREGEGGGRRAFVELARVCRSLACVGRSRVSVARVCRSLACVARSLACVARSLARAAAPPSH
jgi:hypothetical protein